MSRLIQPWLADHLQATLDSSKPIPLRRNQVLQVIEANENFRMMLCHDGINQVVIHVPPKALDSYRAGITCPSEQNSLDDNAIKYDDNIHSEDQLQQSPVPTLNLLAKNACLIQIGDWHWSTTAICGAWLRGPMRSDAQGFAYQSRPYCIQIGLLRHNGVNLPHNIYSKVDLIDVNRAPEVSSMISSFKDRRDSFIALRKASTQESQDDSAAISVPLLDAYGRVPLISFEVTPGKPLSLSDLPESVRPSAYTTHFISNESAPSMFATSSQVNKVGNDLNDQSLKSASDESGGESSSSEEEMTQLDEPPSFLPKQTKPKSSPKNKKPVLQLSEVESDSESVSESDSEIGSEWGSEFKGGQGSKNGKMESSTSAKLSSQVQPLRSDESTIGNELAPADYYSQSQNDPFNTQISQVGDGGVTNFRGSFQLLESPDSSQKENADDEQATSSVSFNQTQIETQDHVLNNDVSSGGEEDGKDEDLNQTQIEESDSEESQNDLPVGDTLTQVEEGSPDSLDLDTQLQFETQPQFEDLASTGSRKKPKPNLLKSTDKKQQSSSSEPPSRVQSPLPPQQQQPPITPQQQALPPQEQQAPVPPQRLSPPQQELLPPPSPPPQQQPPVSPQQALPPQEQQALLPPQQAQQAPQQPADVDESHNVALIPTSPTPKAISGTSAPPHNLFVKKNKQKSTSSSSSSMNPTSSDHALEVKAKAKQPPPTSISTVISNLIKKSKLTKEAMLKSSPKKNRGDNVIVAKGRSPNQSTPKRGSLYIPPALPPPHTTTSRHTDIAMKHPQFFSSSSSSPPSINFMSKKSPLKKGKIDWGQVRLEKQSQVKKYAMTQMKSSQVSLKKSSSGSIDNVTTSQRKQVRYDEQTQHHKKLKENQRRVDEEEEESRLRMEREERRKRIIELQQQQHQEQQIKQERIEQQQKRHRQKVLTLRQEQIKLQVQQRRQAEENKQEKEHTHTETPTFKRSPPPSGQSSEENRRKRSKIDLASMLGLKLPRKGGL